jgi:hypothetical protein
MNRQEERCEGRMQKEELDCDRHWVLSWRLALVCDRVFFFFSAVKMVGQPKAVRSLRLTGKVVVVGAGLCLPEKSGRLSLDIQFT